MFIFTIFSKTMLAKIDDMINQIEEETLKKVETIYKTENDFTAIFNLKAIDVNVAGLPKINKAVKEEPLKHEEEIDDEIVDDEIDDEIVDDEIDDEINEEELPTTIETGTEARGTVWVNEEISPENVFRT